jgi:signal peptidase I
LSEQSNADYNEKKYTIREALEVHGVIVLSAVGSSMRPLIKNPADRVVIEAADRVFLKLYDIVVFEYGDNLVMHRIIRLGDEEIDARGDFRYTPETNVPLPAVFGKVKGVYKAGKLNYIDFEKSRLYRWYVAVWCKTPDFIRYPLIFACQIAARVRGRLKRR